ncbi:MAG: hypothetical protein WCW87_04135 [Candidatus Paceibacterota bacterium]
MAIESGSFEEKEPHREFPQGRYQEGFSMGGELAKLDSIGDHEKASMLRAEKERDKVMEQWEKDKERFGTDKPDVIARLKEEEKMREQNS